jgi:hypothetical protein
MAPGTHVASDDLDLPAHLSDLLDDEQFREELRAELEVVQARLRVAPNPLANVTRADVRRSRASALPEIIGSAPGHKPGGCNRD